MSERKEGSHEAHYFKLDCSKAKMRLEWQPKRSLADAIKRIVEWHKAHYEGEDMREFSLDQISAYLLD